MTSVRSIVDIPYDILLQRLENAGVIGEGRLENGEGGLFWIHKVLKLENLPRILRGHAQLHNGHIVSATW